MTEIKIPTLIVPPQPWHAECLRLHQSGMNVADIRRKIGKSSAVIRIFLDIKDSRAKEAARRAANGCKGKRRREWVNPGANHPFISHRPTREPKPSDGRREKAVAAAVQAFARQEISREQLSERLGAI